MCTKLWIALILAATVVVAQPEKTSWDILKQGIVEKNPEKRRQAVTAIGSIGLAPEAIHEIEGALKDQDPLVRQTAAAVLGQMKAKQATPALKAALDDASGEVAFAAAKALWEMGDKSGRDLIEDTLTGQQRATESAMTKAKRKMHDPKAVTMMGLKEASGVLLGPFNNRNHRCRGGVQRWRSGCAGTFGHHAGAGLRRRDASIARIIGH